MVIIGPVGEETSTFEEEDIVGLVGGIQELPNVDVPSLDGLRQGVASANISTLDCTCLYMQTDRVGLAYLAALGLTRQVIRKAQVVTKTLPVLETTVTLAKVGLPVTNQLGTALGLRLLILVLRALLLSSTISVSGSIGSVGSVGAVSVGDTESAELHHKQIQHIVR